MKSTGSYPRVHVDTAKVTAVGQAGGILLTETIRAAGLDRALSEALSRWRKPLAVHDPGKIICDLAMSLVLGGEALSDLATLRAEPGVYGLLIIGFFIWMQRRAMGQAAGPRQGLGPGR